MIEKAAQLRGDLPGRREAASRMADAGVDVRAAINRAAWTGLFLGPQREDAPMPWPPRPKKCQVEEALVESDLNMP